MKSFRKLSALLSAALICASLMAGCDGKNDSSSNSIVYYDSSSSSGAMLGDNSSSAQADQSVTEAAPPVNSVDGTIGDTLEQGGISVTLESVVVTIEKNAKNNTLMYAVIDIKNTTDEDIEVNRLSDFTILVDGTDAGMSAITSVTANSAALQQVSDIEKLNGTVASGNSIRGYIPFEVPGTASEITITYLPYKYSSTQANTLGYNFKFSKPDAE